MERAEHLTVVTDSQAVTSCPGVSTNSKPVLGHLIANAEVGIVSEIFVSSQLQIDPQLVIALVTEMYKDRLLHSVLHTPEILNML